MSVPRLRFKEFSEDWEEIPLEQLALVERGKFSVRPRNDPSYFGGSIPFVQTGDIVFAGLYLTRISQTLNEEGLKVSKLFPANTILITIAANIGDTTITKFSVACTDSVVAIQPFENKANPVWLKLILDTKKDELDSKATQNAQKNINLQVLRPLLLNTPSFSEQNKIANFLTAVDEKITQLTQKGELLTRYKKSVMQQIFSQQLRFKDDEGRDFPEWIESLILDFAPLQRGFDLPVSTIVNGNYPVVFSNGILKYHHEYKAVAPGVVTGRSGTIGNVTYVEENYWPHNTSLWVTDFKNNLPKFVYYFYIKFDLLRFSTGSGVPTLNRNNIHCQNILIPSLPEQTKIANFLTALDEKISHNQTQLDAVKQYKQGLLQQLFV